MDKVSAAFKVFFEEPFWVGVAERIVDGRLSASKVIFGAEPKDYEVYAFLLKNYFKLQFSPAVETSVRDGRPNPKRMQREVKKQVKDSGIGTKSQQALKIQQEQKKAERRIWGREQREAEAQRKFELKRQKKKEKHRGR